MEKAGFAGFDRNETAGKIRVKITRFIRAKINSADLFATGFSHAAVVIVPTTLRIAARGHGLIVYQVDGVFYDTRVFYHKKHTPFGIRECFYAAFFGISRNISDVFYVNCIIEELKRRCNPKRQNLYKTYKRFVQSDDKRAVT